jgi:hypothetical protein
MWQPTLTLERHFTPTRDDKYGELRKAQIKNHNLPILQYMYNGNELEPLKCMISGRLGWVDFPCLVTGKHKQRFDIDFNHIRQEQLGDRVAGYSKDKGYYGPSDVFRSKRIDENAKLFYEFLSIMPISQEYHSYITQDSALGHMTLRNFNKKYWPWALQSEKNYQACLRKYGIKSNITYAWLIDHLSNIEHAPLHERLK